MTIAADKGSKGWSWIGRAIPWWLGELAAICDDAAQRLGITGRNAVTLEAGERYWLLSRGGRPLGQIDRTAPEAETRAALTRLAASGHARAPITVEMPQDRILTKRITLPAMARRELERVLHFEIARHFPFPAERVHFGHRVIARDAEDGRTIEVEIVAVAREAVDEILAALADAGLRAASVTLAGALPLVLAVPGIGRGATLTRGERSMLLSLGALALVAAASPVVRDRMAITASAQALAAMHPQAQAALDERARERRAAQALAGPLRLAASRPPLVAVLDALTKAVPDGSWLTSLSVSGREIVMDGLSPSAAAVALALEQSGAFANIVFRAPITRDPDTGLEHFALGAAIAGSKP